MEAVGNFTFEDKIIPNIPGDGLLFDSTKLTSLWQKNYSILTHLPPVSHTGCSSNKASGGMPSLSTFQLDAEALSQEVTPPVTPSHHPPDSTDGKKSHHHHYPKGKVLPKKKDEAKHKDSESTSSEKFKQGWCHVSSEAYPGPNRLPFPEEMEGASACSFLWAHKFHMPSLPKDMTDTDEQPSFLPLPAMTSTPPKIQALAIMVLWEWDLGAHPLAVCLAPNVLPVQGFVCPKTSLPTFHLSLV